MRSHAKLYLYKRGNGKYYIGQRLEHKVIWRSTGETTRSAALDHLRQFSEEVARRRDCDSLKEFSIRFLAIAPQGMALKTLNIYRRVFRHLIDVAGDCPLSKLTGEHWDRYKSLRLGTIAPASVNLELRALRACMNTAVSWNLLSTNPFAHRKFVHVPETLPAYFTVDDIGLLKHVVADPLYWHIILFAVLSGCRRGEILALRWSDYDVQRGTVTIQCSSGFRTKTGKHRVVPVHSLLREMLEKRRTITQGDLIFSDNGHQVRGNNVTKRIRHYIRKAGLRRELHLHSLRHYAESRTMPSGDANSNRLNPFPLVNSA